jgi:quinol-cytochrome oxidoreductase complex cytochrome b subunit
MARTQSQKKLWAHLLLPISILLLIHLFFPHDHHYNGSHSEREAEEQVCSVDVADALLRVSAEPDSQCPAAPFHVHSLLPYVLPPLLAALFGALCALLLGRGTPIRFKPYLNLYHAPRGSMAGALRAPPVE